MTFPNPPVFPHDVMEDYQLNRLKEYPSPGAQLDMIYWDKKNSTDLWKEAIDKVKSDNPKP